LNFPDTTGGLRRGREERGVGRGEKGGGWRRAVRGESREGRGKRKGEKSGKRWREGRGGEGS